MTTLPDRPPPSTAAVAIATAIVAALAGYFLGQANSLGLFGGPRITSKESWPNSYDVKVHADSSDEESLSSPEDRDDGEEEEKEEERQGELKSFEDSTEECKLVLVVRTDLGMTKGPPPACLPACLPACQSHFPRPWTSTIRRGNQPTNTL